MKDLGGALARLAAAASMLVAPRALASSVHSSIHSSVHSIVQEPSPELEEAQALFQDGQAYFDALDYQQAIDRWVKAYATLPEEPRYKATRAMILYAIASARLEAYEVDDDPENLQHARRLLEKFKQGLDPEDRESHEAVDGYLRRVDELLAAREPAPVAAPPEPAAEEGPERPAPSPGPDAASDAGPRPPGGRGLVIAGAVLIGVGVGVGVGGGLAFGLAVQRRNEQLAAVASGNEDGLTRDEALAVQRRANSAETGELVTIGVGAGVTAVGVGLLVAGVVKRRRSIRELALQPTLAPTGAGVTLLGRF